MTVNCLGVITGKLFKLLEAHNAIADDMGAFHAPGECYGLAYKGWERDVVAYIREVEQTTGYTGYELFADIEARTTDKWCYRHSIAMLQNVWQIAMDEIKEAQEKKRRMRRPRLPRTNVYM